MRGLVTGCLGKIAFIVFLLVFLAVYIKYNGPVV